MRNLRTYIAILLFLPFMNGCPHMVGLRMSQDSPQDLPVLLEQNEFHRASLLLDRNPSLDTAGQRTIIASMAKNYENTAIADAIHKESEDAFVEALNIIDTALLRIPESTLLPAYRRKIDDTRRLRLRSHERSTLLAESHYLADQQQAYRERESLRQPGFMDKWQQSRNRQAARSLIKNLFDCSRTAIKDAELETAGQCLDTINALDPTLDTTTIRTRLNAARMIQKQDRTQVARIKYARKQKILKKTNKQKAAVIIQKTGEALTDDNLLLANSIFKQMPASETNSPETIEMATRLNSDVNNEVSKRVASGDRHYRADRVSAAITDWSDALLLKPADVSISERLERARKVLARLDELKKKQHD